MDGRVREITRAVKRYDWCLFAQRERNGAIHLYRRSHNNSAASPHFVFALTDNWLASGKPREWGIEVILARLKAIDLWKDETVVDRIERDLEKAEQSKEREFKNNVEAFLKDFRRQFARTTNDINVSQLAKVDPRAKLGA